MVIVEVGLVWQRTTGPACTFKKYIRGAPACLSVCSDLSSFPLQPLQQPKDFLADVIDDGCWRCDRDAPCNTEEAKKREQQYSDHNNFAKIAHRQITRKRSS